MGVFWTLVVFFAWIALIGVAIWLLVRLVRNENFFPGDRARRIAVTGLLALLALVFPLVGIPVLLVVSYFTPREPEPTSSAASPPSS